MTRSYYIKASDTLEPNKALEDNAISSMTHENPLAFDIHLRVPHF